MPGMLWRLPDRVLSLGQQPLVMGIVNVTPDSFSDGGCHDTTEAAIAHALRLVDEGADLLDIGGESTRPRSSPVSVDEEVARVVPVVEGLLGRVTVPISVDTSKASVARLCLAAGASIINDVTGLRGDPEMASVAVASGAGVVVMHMQGTPATMQDDPRYDDVSTEVLTFFQERLQTLTNAGIAPDRMTLDPGFGFGKTFEHNRQLLVDLAVFQTLGRPVLLGVSRKRLLGTMLNRPVGERLAGSLAAACYAMARRAVQVLRVHDVAATRDAVRVFAALGGA
jgi:dihydropteroate synthase